MATRQCLRELRIDPLSGFVDWWIRGSVQRRCLSPDRATRMSETSDPRSLGTSVAVRSIRKPIVSKLIFIQRPGFPGTADRISSGSCSMARFLPERFPLCSSSQNRMSRSFCLLRYSERLRTETNMERLSTVAQQRRTQLDRSLSTRSVDSDQPNCLDARRT